MDEAVDRLQQERFDIILIDSLLGEGDKACRCLGKISSSPVALLVREKDTNWKKFDSWELDGFVFEGASGTEVTARIRAISRRRIYAANV